MTVALGLLIPWQFDQEPREREESVGVRLKAIQEVRQSSKMRWAVAYDGRAADSVAQVQIFASSLVYQAQ